jgi:hypothetical protein
MEGWMEGKGSRGRVEGREDKKVEGRRTKRQKRIGVEKKLPSREGR